MKYTLEAARLIDALTHLRALDFFPSRVYSEAAACFADAQYDSPEEKAMVEAVLAFWKAAAS